MDATNHIKWSQKDKYYLYVITYMWNLKYGTYDPIYKTERSGIWTDLCFPWVGEKEGHGWGFGDW